MSCSGCKNHVQQTLAKINGVQDVSINLEKHEAEIETKNHIPLDKFQRALKEDGGNYSITNPEEKPLQKKQPKQNGNGTYYCPMHCEGDKTYNKPGDCPVCGMDLVEEVSTQANKTIYTCPMHSEIEEDEAGDCPKCGMDLVPKEPDLSSEEKNYKSLKNKFWLSVIFTLPIFLISMSAMLPNNPLYNLMSIKYWNWIQFFLSLPVVFYTCWMFF